MKITEVLLKKNTKFRRKCWPENEYCYVDNVSIYDEENTILTIDYEGLIANDWEYYFQQLSFKEALILLQNGQIMKRKNLDYTAIHMRYGRLFYLGEDELQNSFLSITDLNSKDWIIQL